MKKVRRLSSVLLIVCLLLSFATHVQASGISSQLTSLLIYSDFYEWNAEMVNYNCYAYAIDYKENGKLKECNPGFKCGLNYDDAASISSVAILVSNDLGSLGYDCILQQNNRPTSLGNWSNIIAMRKDTTYDVALVLPDGSYDPFNDYHFAKMKSDGWYHKPGPAAVLKFKSAPDNETVWTSEAVDGAGYYFPAITYDSAIIYMSYKESHGTLMQAWTENDYHSGKVHYYEFEYICPDCGESMGTEWISRPCVGSYCIYPWSVEPEYDVS